MKRRNVIPTLLAIGSLILMPGIGTAQADRLDTAIKDLKARTEKLGAPKVEGKALYFGTTKVSNDVVDAVAKDDGVAATLFAKSGDEYVRAATTVKKDDGSSAVGTPLDGKSPAVAKINKGEAYHGDATIFGKPYVTEYEPIKSASGAVIGAYFVGEQK